MVDNRWYIDGVGYYEDLTERERLCYQSGYEYGSYEKDGMLERFEEHNDIKLSGKRERDLFLIGRDKALSLPSGVYR